MIERAWGLRTSDGRGSSRGGSGGAWSLGSVDDAVTTVNLAQSPCRAMAKVTAVTTPVRCQDVGLTAGQDRGMMVAAVTEGRVGVEVSRIYTVRAKGFL